MKIAYYMPFKPLGHVNPSGDLVFGTELHDHLNQTGNMCTLISKLRCRWIYLNPLKMINLFFERLRVVSDLQKDPPDIWLSYHCYYKAPDLLGPYCAKKLNIPYVIFQGIYSTKRRKVLKTKPGFYLNKRVLQTAQLVFTNKRRDELNLLRLLPREQICYLPPGIHTKQFAFDSSARDKFHKEWEIKDEVVIMAAAMFRPGVKTKGLKILISACTDLKNKGRRIRLVIAGDGKTRKEVQQYADVLGESALFCGKIPRKELYTLYSGADIFAFPGIEESLGMVYLEAQCCGLPVVAFQDWGGGEAVIDGQTGLLSPAAHPEQFTENLDKLILQQDLRQQLGKQAAEHVRANHELSASYNQLNSKLEQIAENIKQR